MVSIQSSYMSPFKCKCSSPFGNLVSCSLLTFCLYSLSCLSCGDVICGTSAVYMAACTTISTTYTNVGTLDGATLPFITFCALTSMFSCSRLTFEPKGPPSSTLFFLLRALLGDSIVAFFLFSNATYNSIIIFTLAGGFCELSFWWTNKC